MPPGFPERRRRARIATSKGKSTRRIWCVLVTRIEGQGLNPMRAVLILEACCCCVALRRPALMRWPFSRAASRSSPRPARRTCRRRQPCRSRRHRLPSLWKGQRARQCQRVLRQYASSRCSAPTASWRGSTSSFGLSAELQTLYGEAAVDAGPRIVTKRLWLGTVNVNFRPLAPVSSFVTDHLRVEPREAHRRPGTASAPAPSGTSLQTTATDAKPQPVAVRGADHGARQHGALSRRAHRPLFLAGQVPPLLRRPDAGHPRHVLAAERQRGGPVPGQLRARSCGTR